MDRYPDIRDLQLLIALAQRKHFTKAAADCGISQPAFSARILALEKDLGIPIVRRGNKFLGFTSDGELLLKWAQKILTDAEGLRQDMEVSRGDLQGSLVLGVVPTALPYAASIATELRVSYPKLTLRIQSLSSLLIARGLSDFSLDAGITYKDEAEISSSRFDAFTAALAQVTNGTAATIAPEKLADSLFLGDNIISLSLTDPVLRNTIGLATMDYEPALPAIDALRKTTGIRDN